MKAMLHWNVYDQISVWQRWLWLIKVGYCKYTDYLALVTQSWPTLWQPMDCSLPGSSVHGILQATVLKWVPFPSPGDLPNLGIKPRSPTLQLDSLLWNDILSPIHATSRGMLMESRYSTRFPKAIQVNISQSQELKVFVVMFCALFCFHFDSSSCPID